jgi:1,4-dihydroxy-2-naphthoyl-CoA synthase
VLLTEAIVDEEQLEKVETTCCRSMAWTSPLAAKLAKNGVTDR